MFIPDTISFTAHIEYDNEDGNFSEISDIDKEQSQARYDPRLLSEDVSGYHSQSGDAGASSCYNAHVRYLHGQKVKFNTKVGSVYIIEQVLRQISF